jgi:hypothetical protein
MKASTHAGFILFKMLTLKVEGMKKHISLLNGFISNEGKNKGCIAKFYRSLISSTAAENHSN